MSWTLQLANYWETPEEALKLMLGILFSYPCFWFFRLTLSKSNATIQHLYFITTGMSLAYWSIGVDAIMHNTICISVTYSTLLLLGGTYLSSLLCFIFNLGYLLVGYYFTETESYDICWTMPHCVLCLRLIAVSMDVWDGTKVESKLANDQKRNCLKEMPTLLEMFSQAFFLGGYFIGPQFSMRKFKAFIQRNINENVPNTYVSYAILRVGIGFLYLMFHVYGSKLVPLNLVTTDEFFNMTWSEQIFWYFIWVKVMMSKYIGAWLFSEGAMIFSGMAYELDGDGNVKWNGGANVRLGKWEFSSKLAHLIESFNINTNQWSASYIYKRMRFMNNKQISQGATLGFLAIWHGLHSGYYLTFFNEFLMINFEKELEALIAKSEGVQHLLTYPAAKPLTWILGKLYIAIFLPHCFLPFGLLTFDKYYPVIRNSYGAVYIFFMTWPIWKIPLAKMIVTPKKKLQTQAFVEQNGQEKKSE